MILALISAEATARLTREARIARLTANAQQAHYAAEAGFNQVRALLVACDGDPATLDGTEGTLTYTDESGEQHDAGQYTIEVGGTGPYRIRSTGRSGSGQYQATRVLQGQTDAQREQIDPATNACLYRKVTTTYDP